MTIDSGVTTMTGTPMRCASRMSCADLQRDRAVELLVASGVHLAHATAAEQMLDEVAADDRARRNRTVGSAP
jgi:hypothetical protein